MRSVNDIVNEMMLSGSTYKSIEDYAVEIKSANEALLNKLYDIVAGENPAPWRTEVLNELEIAMFGKTIEVNDEEQERM